MSSLLGKTMQWALDGPAADNYNQQTSSAAAPLVAGEVRPVVVVGENTAHTPDGADGHTVNVQVYTDGPQVHYVPAVPVSALSELGAEPPAPPKPPAVCNNSLTDPCPLHGDEHTFNADTGKLGGEKTPGDVKPEPKASGSDSKETSKASSEPDSHAGESPVADDKADWAEGNQGTGDTYNPKSGPYPPPLAGKADNPAPNTAATQGERTQANATGTEGSAQTGPQAGPGSAATAGTGSPT